MSYEQGGVVKPAAFDGQKYTLGFAGVGTLNSALVAGFCKAYSSGSPLVGENRSSTSTTTSTRCNVKFPLYLSPRGRQHVGSLAKEFGPTCIAACASTQEVFDACDVFLVGVRPPQISDLLKDLDFAGKIHRQKRTILVNLLSTVKNYQLKEHIVERIRVAPKNEEEDPQARLEKHIEIVKAVPLPPARHLRGCTVVAVGSKDSCTAAESLVVGLFESVGHVTTCVETELPVFQAITGMMGPFYQQLHWLESFMADVGGVERREATRYLTAFFRSILTDIDVGDKDANDHDKEKAIKTGRGDDHDAASTSAGTSSLMALTASQTKGGINEQAMKLLREKYNHREGVDATMQVLLERLHAA
ncbi:unnamed protein product [Amoebophrya sp. A25]|nr:unnamed protein product [Amoebophrya sp. A25]|eukprot:GSA25T00009989001.1